MELAMHFDLERYWLGVWHELTVPFRDNKYAALDEKCLLRWTRGRILPMWAETTNPGASSLLMS